MYSDSKLIVISFIGPSAAGKSTAMKQLKENYQVLEERYIELNEHKIDNRLVLSKWGYIQYWFNEVLKAKNRGTQLIITDRCPIDTCAYVSHNSKELLEVIKTSFDELKRLNILVNKILVTCNFEELQDRIYNRLKDDQRRIDYNEGDIEHNRRAYNFFIENISLWDDVIDTSNIDPEATLKSFTSIIEKIINKK